MTWVHETRPTPKKPALTIGQPAPRPFTCQGCEQTLMGYPEQKWCLAPECQEKRKEHAAAKQRLANKRHKEKKQKAAIRASLGIE